MHDTNDKSVIAGIMITAGSAIGAGMFSLPVVSSGMWFSLSLVVLVFCWYLNYLSSLILLEVNLYYPPGASFNTFVLDLLGAKWNVVAGLGVAFLLYILLYAYFSAFGNIITESFSAWEISAMPWFDGLISLLFGGFLAAIVWKSTSWVGRLSTVLVAGMVITFILSMLGLTFDIRMTNLFDTEARNRDYFPFMWASLPYLLTSFGFASVVPSLFKYYKNRPEKIVSSLFYGSLIALSVYAFFLFIAFGLISRAEFLAINAAGGNMGHLVGTMSEKSTTGFIRLSLNFFSNFAIISSFLGVGLSLFDYVADRFSFREDPHGRFYTACLTFLPPGLASFFFPNGFIAAIGFAGLVMVLSYFVIPVLMVLKIRKQQKQPIYRLWGGRSILWFLFASSLVVAVCHILAMLNLLPVY